ncbi:MAG: AraC family transcriptional regulator [Bacteroidetes bacterium]|nr:AraC family transcriptional regulator [Bacteroidota bacterium]MCB0841786.1 AraC family transcriptional regulator [Bacteroidota bacterium]
MKPSLESISIPESDQSILVFEVTTSAFEPFWHYHPEVELTLIIRGEGMRFVGDNIEPFSDHDLVLLGKNLPHQWITIEEDKEEVQSAVVIQFPEGIFQNFPEFKGVNNMIRAANRGIHFQNPPLEIIDKISLIPDLPSALKMSQFMNVLYQLSLHKAYRYLSENPHFRSATGQKTQLRINACTSYIFVHLSEPISVNQMAERMNMVPQSFCRWFRKHTGHSFVSFLNKTRIQHACQYLVNTDWPIQQIAYSVGFENISHFNRTFKKLQRVSPSEFRKRNVSQ